FACAGKTEPPSRLILSQTSAGSFDRITSSLAPHIAQFLCSSQGPFLRPALQSIDRVARRRRSRPAVALGLRLAPALPGCALPAPSTARGSSGSDTCIVGPRQLE